MSRPPSRRSLLLALFVTAACTETSFGPDQDATSPLFAKGGKPGGGGGGTSSTAAATTIYDSGAEAAVLFDVRSDGKGAYVDGECGVYAAINKQSDGRLGSQLVPAANALTSEEETTCGGPRSASLYLLVRHVSDDPHVDDTSTPLGGFAVGQIKMILDNGVFVVNAATPLPGNSAPTSCFKIGKNGRVSGAGLRFDAVNYPGSDYVAVTQLGTNHYRVQSRPWPDNVGYCENNDGVSFWHVVVDMEIRAKN